MTAFYDTSSLLLAQERAFDEPFYLSSVTVAELEHIKVSEHKSGELKYQARKLVRTNGVTCIRLLQTILP